MKIRQLLAFLLLCCASIISVAQDSTTINLTPSLPQFDLTDFQIQNQNGQLLFISTIQNGETSLSINGEAQKLIFQGGNAVFDFETDAAGTLVLFRTADDTHKLYHFAKLTDGNMRIRQIPLWMSLLPPLLAIALALIFKEVIISLFMGIWVGAFIAGGMRIESLYYIFQSIWKVIERYVMNALNDGGHLSIIIFSLMIGGMVAIISRNGGMAGVVKSLSKYARSPRSTQFITWLLGVAIFFDDYANTLIVGNTMRSVTDKFKISREKLAYIVDSTAAPVAAIAFITTWIGAELGYIDSGMVNIQGFEGDTSAYSIFIASLKYSFYPILTLSFMLILIYTKRDFGAMYQAELRARTTGEVARRTSTETESAGMEDLQPVKGAPLKWYNAAVPVLVVIFMTIFGLIDTGMGSLYAEAVGAGFNPASQSWGDLWAVLPSIAGEDAGFFMKLGKLIGASDSYVALLWASLSGVLVAVIMTLSAKIMRLEDTINTLLAGFKTMLPALMILTLAWALAITTQELHTADYLSFALRDSVNPYFVPMLIFILAAAIAFSTGSSWSTMAILYPIALPTTWAICQAQGLDAAISTEILLNSIAVTLAASVLGDHCSPISDTTILSSLASDCNHIDHVRTQLPYALSVGGLSFVCAGLSTWLGGGWLVSFLLCVVSLAFLTGLLLKIGKRVDG